MEETANFGEDATRPSVRSDHPEGEGRSRGTVRTPVASERGGVSTEMSYVQLDSISHAGATETDAMSMGPEYFELQDSRAPSETEERVESHAAQPEPVGGEGSAARARSSDHGGGSTRSHESAHINKNIFLLPVLSGTRALSYSTVGNRM